MAGRLRQTIFVSAKVVSEPSGAEFEAAAETLKLLADPTRLAIIWALLHGEHSVAALAEHVGVRPTAVSQHLAKLRLAGAVRTRRDGNRIFYVAENEHIERLASEALLQADHLVTGGGVTTPRGAPREPRASRSRSSRPRPSGVVSAVPSPQIFRPHSHDAADSIDNALEASERGIHAVKVSFVALMLTALVQLAIVVLTGSVALLADTIHNFSDALTAVPLFLAFRLSRRPSNRRYTYGYHRAEDLAGVFVILMIAVSAVIAAWEAIEPTHPPPAGQPPGCPVRRRHRRLHRQRARRPLPDPRRQRDRVGGARRRRLPRPHRRIHLAGCRARSDRQCGRASNVPTPSSVSASRSRSSRCSEARPGRSTTASWTRSILRSSSRSRQSPPASPGVVAVDRPAGSLARAPARRRPRHHGVGRAPGARRAFDRRGRPPPTAARGRAPRRRPRARRPRRRARARVSRSPLPLTVRLDAHYRRRRDDRSLTPLRVAVVWRGDEAARRAGHRVERTTAARRRRPGRSGRDRNPGDLPRRDR